jgi:hypothetical protein
MEELKNFIDRVSNNEEIKHEQINEGNFYSSEEKSVSTLKLNNDEQSTIKNEFNIKLLITEQEEEVTEKNTYYDSPRNENCNQMQNQHFNPTATQLLEEIKMIKKSDILEGKQTNFYERNYEDMYGVDRSGKFYACEDTLGENKDCKIINNNLQSKFETKNISKSENKKNVQIQQFYEEWDQCNLIEAEEFSNATICINFDNLSQKFIEQSHNEISNKTIESVMLMDDKKVPKEIVKCEKIIAQEKAKLFAAENFDKHVTSHT